MKSKIRTRGELSRWEKLAAWLIALSAIACITAACIILLPKSGDKTDGIGRILLFSGAVLYVPLAPQIFLLSRWKLFATPILTINEKNPISQVLSKSTIVFIALAALVALSFIFDPYDESLTWAHYFMLILPFIGAVWQFLSARQNKFHICEEGVVAPIGIFIDRVLYRWDSLISFYTDGQMQQFKLMKQEGYFVTLTSREHFNEVAHILSEWIRPEGDVTQL